MRQLCRHVRPVCLRRKSAPTFRQPLPHRSSLFLFPFTTNNTTTLVHGHLPRLHCCSPWRQCTNGALQSGHHPRYVCVVPLPSKLRRQTDQSMCVDCKQKQPGADGALVATDSYAPWDGAGVSEATGVKQSLGVWWRRAKLCIPSLLTEPLFPSRRRHACHYPVLCRGLCSCAPVLRWYAG